MCYRLCPGVRCNPIVLPRDGEAWWTSSDGRRENYTSGSKFVVFRTLHFECRGNLELAGKSSITCLANGNWSGTVPVCTGKESITYNVQYTRKVRHCLRSQQGYRYICDCVT